MQLLESIISFAVLLSLSVALSQGTDSGVDDSLYMYKLMGDAKNVIHLKGGFADLGAGNAAGNEINRLTGLCMEMGQTELTPSLRVAPGAASGPALVPVLKPAAGYANLTGIVRDDFYFGPCMGN